MQALLKIIGILSDLILWVVRVKRAEKRKVELDAVRNDPAGEFANEFGGLSDGKSRGPVLGDKAGVEVDSK